MFPATLKQYDERVYENPRHPRYKEPIAHEIGGKRRGDTVMLGALEFKNGCFGSLTFCSEGFFPRFRAWRSTAPRASSRCPTRITSAAGATTFSSRVGNAVNGKNEVFRVPFTHGFGDTDPSIPTLSGKREPCYNSWRGLAVVDMAYAIRRGRPHRSSADLALHTVEIIDAIERSMQDNKVYTP